MMLRRIGRVLWWTGAATVVALAFALSAARMLLPGMSEYREQVEVLAGELLRRPVEIGSLSAAWWRLSPVLRLQQVVVRDPALPGGRLEVGEVQVGLDVPASLWRGKWLLSGIRVMGVQVSLKTDLTAPREQPPGLDAFYLLMRQKNVTLERFTLDWEDPGLFETPVHLHDLSAQIRNDGWRHQLLVQARANAPYGDTLKLAADLSGPVQSPLDWYGRLYIKTSGFRLPVLKRLLADSAYDVEGNLDLELWAGVRKRRVNWTAGSLRVAGATLSRHDTPELRYGVDSLRTRFSARLLDTGWTLELRDFRLQRDGQAAWPATRMRATLAMGANGAPVLRGQIGRVVIPEVAAAIPLLPRTTAEWREQIARLRPRGVLTDTEFQLVFPEQSAPRVSLRAAFSGLGLSAHRGMPGAEGLSGYLEGNLDSGRVVFDTRNASLRLPRVFTETPVLSRLSGELHWRRFRDRWRLRSEHMQLSSGALESELALQLDWQSGDAAPWIDLRLRVPSLPMTEVRYLLPDKVLKPKALNWLQRAFRAGAVRDVRMLLQGPLNRLPFDGNDGRMEVRFDFEDVLLDYHPLWGQLDALRGSALFVGRSMRITGDSATILDANVDRAVAVIENFARPVLNVDGTVSGTLESLLAYIDHTPLKARFGEIVERVTTAGDATLQLDLDIPLRHELGKIRIDGEVGFLNDSLQVDDSDIVLEQVNGSLHFSRNGVRAREVDARLFGQPVKVSVYPGDDAGARRTVVDVEGRLGLVERLVRAAPALAPYLDGSSYWHALLQIPADATVADRSVRLSLRSDLEGTAIRLPPPFTKAAGQPRPIDVSWTPGRLAREPLRVAFNDEVHAALLMTAGLDGLRKATVHFGDGDARLPANDSIHLEGWVDLLDLDGWIDLLRKTLKQGDGAGARMPPFATDLHVRRAVFLAYVAEGLNIASRADAPWQFSITGRDMEGKATWKPAASTASVPELVLRLAHLAAVKAEALGVAPDKASLTPERLPDLDLDIGKLQLGPLELGKVVVRGQRVPEGMRFPLLQVDSRAIVFTGEGAWLKREDQHSTRFRAEVSGGELGELIKMFGDHGSIQGGRMKGRVALDWPGNPAEFSLATVEGEIRLTTGKGRLVEVKEGAGKLLNLFNLNSLQRRLSLDFSDLTREGFAFDKMAATLVISDGNAYTDDFVISGSSAVIEISGRTGLVARDYDQLITVTPQVSSSLPLAGALAGGPAVGAAVFLAEKLVGKQFNRMAQVRYKVTGSWDKPVYTRLKPERPGVNVAPAEESGGARPGGRP